MRTACQALRTDRARQSGVTLIEALVALLIMGFGMVALLGLQSTMRRSADHATQRSEAVRLAQRDMETLRSFSTLVRPANAASGTSAYADIDDATALNIGNDQSNTEFQLVRDVTPMQDGSLDVIVTVSWVDRANETMEVTLRSLIARIDPRLSASLAIPPDGAPTRRPMGRSVAIPPGAKDLGNGRSVFKPPALSSGVAWVFDNRSGLIVQRCVGLDPSTASANITQAEVDAYCGNISSAYLLSGAVRFSTASSPDPVNPTDAALPLDLWIDAVNADTPAPSHECFDNAPSSASTAMRDGVLYYCAVFPSGDAGVWSGRLLVSGISLDNGIDGGAHKICRYSADYDGDGSIGNPEHPEAYVEVGTSLPRQNFLVIAAAHRCPSGSAADPSAGRFFNSATVLHQS
jgi:Tfp pilus assembly protein PilV